MKFKVTDYLLILAAIIVVLGGCTGCHYLKYKAFKQKYPQASYWAFILEK